MPEIELPGLPEWLQEDENFQKVSGAISSFGDPRDAPKKIEFDKYGRLVKNVNKGIVKKTYLGTKGTNSWADKEEKE